MSLAKVFGDLPADLAGEVCKFWKCTKKTNIPCQMIKIASNVKDCFKTEQYFNESAEDENKRSEMKRIKNNIYSALVEKVHKGKIFMVYQIDNKKVSEESWRR